MSWTDRLRTDLEPNLNQLWTRVFFLDNISLRNFKLMRTFLSWLLAKQTGIAALGLFVMFFCYTVIVKAGINMECFFLPFIISLPFCLLYAIWAVVYTYRNFDEVYSRSKRWRKSNVEKLDSRLGYCFGLFFKCFFTSVVLIMAMTMSSFIVKGFI